jgi:HPt (histidine-containing phosphotransfer) domain-containing protein
MADQGTTDRLLALGAAFAARLQKDAGLLHTLANALPSAPEGDRPQVLEQIRELAHRLRGTAPAFEAEDIGNAAARLEETIVDRQDAGARLAELLRMIDTALGAHGPARKFRPRL